MTKKYSSSSILIQQYYAKILINIKICFFSIFIRKFVLQECIEGDQENVSKNSMFKYPEVLPMMT